MPESRRNTGHTAIEHELNLVSVLPLRELHGAVVESGETQRGQIQGVILIQPPRLFRSLFWKDGARSLEIAGREREGGLFDDARIAATRRAVVVTVRVHIIQHAAERFRCEIALQRPGSV